MTDTVSIVIPSYNHGRFIGRALQSLLTQSHVDWDAIIVDNHSTDDTAAVVARFADPRIRIERIHNNGIIAASRNHGIRAATGDWIALLDSDDWWTPEKLRICLGAGATADLVYHGMKIVRDDGAAPSRATVRSRSLVMPVWADLMIAGNPIVNSSVIVRRSMLDAVGPLCEARAMIAAEDLNLWLRIARRSDRFIYIPALLGTYLEHGTGMSQKDMSLVHAAATEEFVSELSPAQLRRRDAYIAYIRGRHQFQRGEFRDASDALRIAVRDGSPELRVKAGYMLFRVLIGKARRR